MLVIHGYMFYRIPGIDSVSMLSPTTLLLSIFLYRATSDYLAYEPLLVDYDFCLAPLNLVFRTLCIWVSPSHSLPITVRNILSYFSSYFR